MSISVTLFIILLLVALMGVVRGDNKKSNNRPAEWMSGKLGIGLRLPGGDFIERHEEYGSGWGLDWSLLVNQFTSVGASYAIVNLSEGAFGTTWMAHHPTLYSLAETPTDTTCVPFVGSASGWDINCQTAPTPSADRNDDFQDLLDAFHDANIKVIVYVASQGPAMFKAGSSKAFDVFRRTVPFRTDCITFKPNDGPKDCFDDPDNCCSPFIGNWIKYVTDLNGGSIDYPKLHEAFANVVIAYYAETYKDSIDGWWFDHAQESTSAACGAGSTCRKDFIDKTAVRNAIRAHQPNVPIAFNTCPNAQKSPLQICAKDFEDFTAGHPTPLKDTLPFSSLNYPMVTSIEDSTIDGFFEKDGWESLGHVFMPTGTLWNGPTIPVVWTTPYPYTTTPYNWLDHSWSETVASQEGWNTNATDWFQRTIAAGGSWTWNLPRAGNNAGDYFLLHPNHLALVEYAVSQQQQSPTMGPSDIPSQIPSQNPSTSPSDIPSQNPSFISSDIPSNMPSVAPSKVLSSVPSTAPSSMPSQLP